MGMFSLIVDDELSLVLAEDRHAGVMTELIARNQQRLARWEPWAEQPAVRPDWDGSLGAAQWAHLA